MSDEKRLLEGYGGSVFIFLILFFFWAQGIDPGSAIEASTATVHIKAGVQNVEEPDGGLWTFLDVVIGDGFTGDPERDIESIMVEGPQGPLDIGKKDFKYFPGRRDYWLRLPGSPVPGVYTFTVKGRGLDYQVRDSQTIVKSIPLLDPAKVKPADNDLVRIDGPTFSWPMVDRDDALYYQLEIRRTNGDPVYRSPAQPQMHAYRVPHDVLNPLERYRWRVRITDGEDFLRIQNRTQTPWFTLTMAENLDYRYSQPPQINDGWLTSSLDQEGIVPDTILEGMQQLVAKKFINVDSVLLVKNGKLVLEDYFNGYDRQTDHLLASTTKSITSILFGIAVDHQMVTDLDTELYKYFPEYKGTPWVDGQYPVSLRHALTMTAGLNWDETFYPYSDPRNDVNAYYQSREPVAALLGKSAAHPPGTRWNYNSGLTILLGEVIRKASGLDPDQFAEKYLFRPLGINHYRWLRHEHGPLGAHGDLFMTPRAMAKVGQLMLDRGLWQEKRIVSEKWVEESTRYHIDTGHGYGYGYQWRRGVMNVSGRSVEGYWASGLGGQKIYVFPELDLVVVFTSKVFENTFGHELNDSMLVNYIVPAVLPPAPPLKPIQPSPLDMAPFCGDYRISDRYVVPAKVANEIYKVRIKEGRLMVETSWGDFEIVLESEIRGAMNMPGIGNVYVNIVKDGKGTVTGAVREIGFRRLYLDKISD